MPKRKQSKQQSKRNKKIKSEETCVTETLDYEEPLLDANGEVVWADHIFGNLSFYSPGTDEEINAVVNTCNNPLNFASKES